MTAYDVLPNGLQHAIKQDGSALNRILVHIALTKMIYTSKIITSQTIKLLYECKAAPQYCNRLTIASIQEFTITDEVNRVTYLTHGTVSVVENEMLVLTCSVIGGIRSSRLIIWTVDDLISSQNLYRVNLTKSELNLEESVLIISKADTSVDGAIITCEARQQNISLYLNIKRKPILKIPDTLTEGTPSDVMCMLNGTADLQPSFLWKLDDNDISTNSTRRRTDGVFSSTLIFHPVRSYFSKELTCEILNEERRSASVILEVTYPATITSLYATPTNVTEINGNVTLVCQASGFPLPRIYWSKHRDDDQSWLAVTRATPGRLLNETAADMSILINDVLFGDIGRYKCIASNRLGSDEKEIPLYLEEIGIIFDRSTVLFENIPVNITCKVKQRNEIHHIRWIIGRLDITQNATQDDYMSERGDFIVRSILLFYPDRLFDGMVLTCNGGIDQNPVQQLLLNISHCKENPVHSCSVERNRSNARLACEIGEEVPVNEIGLYKYENQLEREFLTVIKGEHYTRISYDLGTRQDAFLVGYNCCTSTERCPQYCQVCVVNEYLTTEEKEQSFILYIVVAIAILFGVIVLLCAILRGRTRGSGNFIKSEDTIGVNTLQAVNFGPAIQSHLGSLPAIYEPMGTGYTTRVHSTSEFSRDDDFFSRDGITDNASEITDLTEVTLMSNIGNKAMSLNEKLSKLYGLHAGLETLEKGSRLSRHFGLNDDECSSIDGDESTTIQTYSLKKVTPQETFISDLTIHSKQAQRGSFFFCAATLNYRQGSMEVTVKVLSEYATRMERRHFVKEIGIVKTLDRHSNIADILGLCCNSKLNYILFEKMTGKTLKQHLLKTRESVSDITAHNEILREYAEQICNGMLFLSNQGFCHPSLRCESVHVDKKGVCKLYDFTPVELCGIKDGYNQDSIAHELVAPEIVKGESHTTRTDVWAFGNLLWELFFYGLDASKMPEDAASKSYVQLIGSREKPIACPDAIYQLMELCWHEDPSSRPIFAAILTELQDMKQRRKMSTTV
ncbi:hypothetical protein BSL78_04686 [Apostichopus japonicus]|uniref:Uncharacterized protein n=1 Tax=Stichopus japonicus TaxID=307972 RepID=A0A2G8LDM4_STIJA|nr:hypothetical protein BSL78_04686 [Apostichopus japonicus]